MLYRIVVILLFAGLASDALFAQEKDVSVKADEAKSLIDQLFAKKFKDARSSSSRKDDVTLAVELFESAQESTTEIELLTLLCRHAYEWGSRDRAGYDTAVAAMELLAKHAPDEASKATANIIALRQRQYTSARGKAKQEAGDGYISVLTQVAKSQIEAGKFTEAIATYKRARSVAKSVRSDQLSEIESALANTLEQQKLTQELSRLKATLKKDPKNKALAKQLIDLLVIKMDDLAEARKYSFLLEDEKTKEMITLASSKAEERTADQSLALGEWYRTMSETSARKSDKLPLLERSLGHYQDFLKKDMSEGLKRKGTELMVAKLQEDVDKLQLGNARDVTKGLIARWGFNDPKNPGYDSRRKHHAAAAPGATGAKWFRDPVRGGVMSFNGTGTRLNLKENPQAGHTAGSWVFWTKLASPPPASSYSGQFYIQETSIWIALSNRGVGIDLSNGSGWFDTSGGNALGAIAGKGKLKPKVWHHMAFTWDGKVVRGYHNGVRSFAVPTVGPKSKAQVAKLGPATSSRGFGSRAGTASNALNGLIDEFRIYNRAISDKEVMAIVRATHPSRSK
jgi:hypothetical protein